MTQESGREAVVDLLKRVMAHRTRFCTACRLVHWDAEEVCMNCGAAFAERHEWHMEQNASHLGATEDN